MLTVLPDARVAAVRVSAGLPSVFLVVWALRPAARVARVEVVMKLRREKDMGAPVKRIRITERSSKRTQGSEGRKASDAAHRQTGFHPTTLRAVGTPGLEARFHTRQTCLRGAEIGWGSDFFLQGFVSFPAA